MSQSIDELPPKEAAATLGIPYRIILRAIQRGELRCTRYSARLFRIKSQDLVRWRDSLSNQAP